MESEEIKEMEKQIILSESELGDLIQREVNNAVRNQQKSLFSSVSVTSRNFLNANARHSISKINYHVLNVCDEPMWVKTLDGPYAPNKLANKIGEPTHDDIHAGEVHDLLRKLSLAVYGVKKNKDVPLDDYSDIVKAYSAFSKVYFSLYEHRLSKLERDDLHD